VSKRKDRRQGAALYESVAHLAGVGGSAAMAEAGGHDAPVSDDLLARSATLSGLLAPSGGRHAALPMMKKFRFQLLHEWMIAHCGPCCVADVGGGKGLLAYLLRQSGWQATVIDPAPQALPDKYKDLAADRQVRIAAEAVPRIDAPFRPEMAAHFDLLVAMHAHGCNILLLDAAAEHGRDVILLPCCIIHEPVVPAPGTHWLECVVEQATRRGFQIVPFRLNFKGQNIGLYAHRR
jgi:hypothetical protein